MGQATLCVGLTRGHGTHADFPAPEPAGERGKGNLTDGMCQAISAGSIPPSRPHGKAYGA